MAFSSKSRLSQDQDSKHFFNLGDARVNALCVTRLTFDTLLLFLWRRDIKVVKYLERAECCICRGEIQLSFNEEDLGTFDAFSPNCCVFCDQEIFFISV